MRSATDLSRHAVRHLLLAAGAVAVLCGAGPALGQAGGRIDSTSQPVIQSIPSRDSMALNQALTRLGKNPRDPVALVDAGNAALAIGDVEAAVGFFRRADQVVPGNPRVKAGLASALVRSADPFDAIPMFEEAERAGAVDGPLLADRGLAYDLVGDNGKAQAFYQRALARQSSDEVIRRLALSYAIAGDKRASGTTLAPLLERQDRAAWRTRAFALAILGQVDEAVAIANATLPNDLAASIAPYLRYMPRLTPAQQAAAANFGQFPRASEIGHDDPRVARYAPAARRPAQASADTSLVPSGEPLGRNARPGRRPAAGSAAAPATPRPQRTVPPEPQPGRGAVAALPPAPPAASPPVNAAGQGAAQLRAVQGPPAPATPAAGAPVSPPRSLAEAFRDFGRPTVDVTPAPGAVDVRRIAPARAAEASPEAQAGQAEKPKSAVAKAEPARAARAKPAPPSHPSRIWVQLAAGRDKTALAWDWRRMSREAAAALRGKNPFVSAWGRTNRLLAGPFPSEAAANAFMSQLRRAGVEDAFIWTSPAGQVVDALAKL